MIGSDRDFMAMALGLGRRGLGRVWPRPAVGCVIAKAGRVVGRGCTRAGPVLHGEAAALSQAGGAARGATAYVTLEPCAHHGATPPCAEALVTAGVARVVCALEDPNPKVAGKGFDILRKAGIAVEVGLCADEARRDHAGFLKVQTQGLPFLTLKLANSFDGRIATASGESKWITGAQARRQVHAMRARHDAVMVGAGTARTDDPSLTVRGLGVTQQPVRVIWSRRLDLPVTGALARTAREVPVWLCTGDVNAERRQAWEDLGARVLQVPIGGGAQLAPIDGLRALAEAGLTRIFCEGGGALAASLLSAGVVDELIGFTAGVALGAEGWPSLGAMGVEALQEAPRFTLIETQQIGGDVLHRWRRA